MKNIKRVLKEALVERMINLIENEENTLNKETYENFLNKIAN